MVAAIGHNEDMSPLTVAVLGTLAIVPPSASDPPVRDRTHVEVQAALSGDGLAGQLTQGDAYTTGLRLQSLVTPPRAVQDRIFARDHRMPSPTLRFGVAAGVAAYTPSDTSTDAIDRTDRPYTGLTFGGAIVELSDGARNRLWTELDYAAIGPQSGASRFHKAFERATAGRAPRGWGNQTRNELHFDLQAKWDHVLVRAFELGHAHLVDLQTHAGIELAELDIAASGGGTVRVGLLRRPFVGVPDAEADAARDACGGWRCRQLRSTQFFVYGRADANVVGRRTSVNGSIFDRASDENRSPHRAHARRFVPTAEIGIVAQPLEHLDVRFSIHHVGREVDTPQARPHTFGRIAVTGRF